MKTLEDILLNPPFPRQEGRELLALAEAKLRSDLSRWLIECVKPLEGELQEAVTAARSPVEETRAAAAAAKVELDAAELAYSIASIAHSLNPPAQVAERRVKASRDHGQATQEAQSAGQALAEAERRLRELQRFIEALEATQPPHAGEVQRIVTGLLGRPGRLVGAVSGVPAGWWG